KTAFGQRRKTLRNSLKSFNLPEDLKEETIFAKRPEQLGVDQFLTLAQKIERHAISDK
ncbi:MAG TPA: 16S rRNA (adenine(1518)-N(6)/adenine(1519)-N(6))-dimethyltransferase, partial [Flavobacteriaceae bacterium]|nr:16S rRNA (adenine(1518)-N(6)/adenine(1519)-N(6))-dimethyltransferase [Flavobacteriaceae bacterium]